MVEILVLLTILAVITLVGHFTWVFLAFLFRLIFAPPREERRPDCPLCGAKNSIYETHCATCAQQVTQALGLPASGEIAATQRQLQILVQRGQLDPSLHRQISQALVGDVARVEPTTDQVGPDVSSASQPIFVPEESPSTPLPVSESIAAATSETPDTESPTEVTTPEIVTAEIVETPGTPAATSSPFAANEGPSAAEAKHPLDRPEPTVPPPMRRRALAVLLRSFMEEKNIRWGEIISGILIVVCAVGLVISLWARLRDSIPYLPALIFLLGTAALHGAGHYTLRKWELHSISRAVLIIATLLVPLNFLAAIALSPPDESVSSVPLYVIATSLGLIAYGVMTWFAGRALLREGALLLLVVVLGAAIGQLLVDRVAPAAIGWWATSFVLLLPIGSYMLAVGATLYRARDRERLSLPRAQPLLFLLGIGTFSVMTPLALFASQATDFAAALSDLSPAISLIGGVVLSAGLLIDRRTVSPRLTPLRTTGTAIACGGGFVLLAAVAFAWPLPVLLLIVGLANAVLLTVMALTSRLSFLLIGAVACGAIAVAITFHVVTGTYPSWHTASQDIVARSVVTGQTALALTGYSVLVLLGGLAWRSRAKEASLLSHPLMLSLSGCGVAAIAAVIAASSGFLDVAGSDLATAVLAVHGIAACVAGCFVADRRPAAAGATLLLLVFVQAAEFNEAVETTLVRWGWFPDLPLLTATIAYSLCLAGAAAAVGRGSAWRDSETDGRAAWRGFVEPLSAAALIAATAALPFVFFVRDDAFLRHGFHAAVMTVTVLIIAVVHVRAQVFLAFQCLATLTVMLLTAAFYQSQHDVVRLFDPDHLRLQLLALAVWCLVWRAGTFAALERRFLRELIPEHRYSVDAFAVPLLMLGILFTSGLSVLRGVLLELGITGSDPLIVAWGAGPAHSWMPWLTLAVLLATTSLLLRQQVNGIRLGALVIALATVPFLSAMPAVSLAATGSALRWYFAAYAVIVVSVLAARGWTREYVRVWFPRVSVSHDEYRQLTLIAILIGTGTVIFVTTWTVARVAAGTALGGPATESFFARVGPTISYAVPMICSVAALLIAATRERQPWFALLGSLVFQYLTSLAYLLPILTAGGELNAVAVAGLLQWNSVALGCYAFVWLALRRWIEDPDAPALGQPTYQWQVVLAIASVVALAHWAAIAIITSPLQIEEALLVLGEWPTYLAFSLILIASRLCYREVTWLQILSPAAIAVVPFVAASYAQQNGVRGTDCLHLLMVGWAVVACLQAVVAWQERDNRMSGRWYVALAAVVVLLAFLSTVRLGSGDGWAFVAVLLLAIGGWFIGALQRRHVLAYISVTLFGLDVALGWNVLTIAPLAQDRLRLVQWIVSAVVAASGSWLILELFAQRTRDAFMDRTSKSFPAHHFFPIPSLLLLSAATFFGLAHTVTSRTDNRPLVMDVTDFWGWTAAVLLLAHFAGLLWDRRSRQAVFGLYLWGLFLVMMILDLLALKDLPTVTGLALGVALHVALTGWLWKQGVLWVAWGHRHGIENPVNGLKTTARWLPVFNSLLTAATLLAGLIIVLTFTERPLRFLAAVIPFLTSIGMAGLAQGNRIGFRSVCLCLITVGGIYVSWADLEPSLAGEVWLDRFVRVLMVFSAVALVFSLLLARRISTENVWFLPTRRASLANACGAILMLVGVLLIEFAFFVDNPAVGAPIGNGQLIAVAFVLAGLVAALITMALLPEPRSWAATESSRMWLVYAAQLVAALLFAHLYLSRPWWFDTELRQYWPYILMAIAFAGAGVGEIFQRMGVRVLAEPLQRTGAFLPVLPALGIWMVASQSNHSLVFFTAGILYVFLSLTRQSTSHVVAAVVAGNAAIWSLLYQHEFAVWRAPQFWMIPPAISVLVAAELNRKKLKPEMLTGLRYGSLIVIYVSSAGEMFVRGIGEQLWPPIVLLSLSMLGAFAGMIFRIRAFLFLGSTFAFLSVLSMVWHASRAIEHSWPWWAFGIGLGLTILGLFGYFEKNRDRVNGILEEMREW